MFPINSSDLLLSRYYITRALGLEEDYLDHFDEYRSLKNKHKREWQCLLHICENGPKGSATLQKKTNTAPLAHIPQNIAFK